MLSQPMSIEAIGNAWVNTNKISVSTLAYSYLDLSSFEYRLESFDGFCNSRMAL